MLRPESFCPFGTPFCVQEIASLLTKIDSRYSLEGAQKIQCSIRLRESSNQHFCFPNYFDILDFYFGSVLRDWLPLIECDSIITDVIDSIAKFVDSCDLKTEECHLDLIAAISYPIHCALGEEELNQAYNYAPSSIGSELIKKIVIDFQSITQGLEELIASESTRDKATAFPN